MADDLNWALLVLVGAVLFGLWWAIKTFDQTESLRRWAEDMNENRNEDERD